MKVLLLAGSAQARHLAGMLANAPGVEAVASLAGATRDPLALALPTRTGGFGGEAEQQGYIEINHFDAVIDATHPFAARISARSHAICTRLGLPYLQVLRPAWTPTADDLWTMVDSGADAPRHIPPGSTVFLATGRQSLPDFAGLSGCHLICRQIDPPEAEFPFPNGEFLIGRPPFSVADEIRLFRDRKVDWLVVKNAGGQLSRSKLDAARALNLPVLMIARPAQPPGERVETAQAALDWLLART